MDSNSVRFHPDYSASFSHQLRKRSALRIAFAILTLGGSVLARQHWDLSIWTSSFKEKVIAFFETIPLFGGLIAAIERLSIHFFYRKELKNNEEGLKKYFQYIQKKPEFVLVRAKEKKELIIQCSLIDHFTFQKPVSTVFFYAKHIEKSLIIGALERALESFPLFAGRLRKMEGHLYIDCKNQGIRIGSVHSDFRLEKLLSKLPKLSPTAFVDEINPDATLRNDFPLLTIKLSYFSEGLAIGYSWHHSVGDMATFMQFLNAVSAAAKGENIPNPIVLTDREKSLQPPETEPLSQSSPLKLLSWADIFQLAKQQSFPTETVYLYFNNEELDKLRNTLSDQASQKLSRNDVLCGHLLKAIAACRDDTSNVQCASIAINARKKLNLDPNTPGNILGMASVQLPKNSQAALFAKTICQNVHNYSSDFHITRKFVENHGGIQKIKWMIPTQFLPKYRNLIFTSWANFGVYSIDFGIVMPDLFLPVGIVPLPWAARIVEGFKNQGRLVALTVPSKIAQRLTQSEMLQKVHQYRSQNQNDETWEWVK